MRCERNTRSSKDAFHFIEHWTHWIEFLFICRNVWRCVRPIKEFWYLRSPFLGVRIICTKINAHKRHVSAKNAWYSLPIFQHVLNAWREGWLTQGGLANPNEGTTRECIYQNHHNKTFKKKWNSKIFIFLENFLFSTYNKHKSFFLTTFYYYYIQRSYYNKLPKNANKK